MSGCGVWVVELSCQLTWYGRSGWQEVPKKGGLEVVWASWRVTRRTGVSAGLSFRPSHRISQHTEGVPNPLERSTPPLPAHVQVIVACLVPAMCYSLPT